MLMGAAGPTISRVTKVARVRTSLRVEHFKSHNGTEEVLFLIWMIEGEAVVDDARSLGASMAER